MTTALIPDDPLARFRELYDELNSGRGWFEDASSLRFAAMTALTCPGSGRTIAIEIRKLAEQIKAESGWFGPLNSSLRFIVAAMLLQHGDSARELMREVERGQQMFRDESLRRGGMYETLAILILRVARERRPVDRVVVRRFRAIYEEMKRHHWWLTGPDDFPACAILATADTEPPERIGDRVERIYQALRRKKFAEGDPLQTAANILYLADRPAAELASRYEALANGFRQAGVRIWQSDYDELAILSFLDHHASHVVDKVIGYRAEMNRLRPNPGPYLSFNLAASIAFMDLVRRDKNMRLITDTKALIDLNAIIQAQQAAVIAAASSAAVVAASSSSS